MHTTDTVVDAVDDWLLRQTKHIICCMRSSMFCDDECETDIWVASISNNQTS